MESNQQPLAFKVCALNHLSTLTDVIQTLALSWHLIQIITRDNTCIEYIMVWCVYAKFYNCNCKR